MKKNFFLYKVLSAAIVLLLLGIAAGIGST